MSVLGWIPQEDSDEVSNEEDKDTVDEIPCNADIDSVISDEEDEDSIDYGSDIDSECDIDAPVMSPISDADGNNCDANPVPCFAGHFAGNSVEPEPTNLPLQNGMASKPSATILIRIFVLLSVDWTRILIHFTVFTIMLF